MAKSPHEKRWTPFTTSSPVTEPTSGIHHREMREGLDWVRETPDGINNPRGNPDSFVNSLDDYVALWKFNGNLDENKSGLSLTGVNAPGYAVGQFENAVNMVAASTHSATRAHTTLLNTNPGTGARSWTIGMWFYQNVADVVQGIVAKETGTTVRDFEININDFNNPEIILYEGDDSTLLISLQDDYTVSLNTWVYLIFGYDAVNGCVSIKNGDNAKVDNDGTIPTGVNNSVLTVGSNGSGENGTYRLDNLIRYNRLLTPAEELGLRTYDG